MITSADNARLKEIVRLQSRARERREASCFVAEGKKLFLETPEALRQAVYVTASFEKEEQALLAGVEYEVVEDRLFFKLSDTQTPQGILTIARMPEYAREELLGNAHADAAHSTQSAETAEQEQADVPGVLGKTKILLLEDIQDPGNMGTILRTAEAAGVSGVILSRGCADPFQPKVVRSTMGSIYRVPFRVEEDFTEAANWLKAQGVRLYATELEAEASYKEIEIAPHAGFLLGNEGNGLSASARALADVRIRIPMQGKVESLNVAIATAILLFT